MIKIGLNITRSQNLAKADLSNGIMQYGITINMSATITYIPAPIFYLETEEGDYLLQEDGSKLIIS